MNTAGHVARIEAEGYSIVEDVLDAEQVAALRDAVASLERSLSITPARNPFEGAQTLRVYNLLARGKRFEALAQNERVLPIVEGVLGRGCLVSSLSSIKILPGEVAQPMHADDQTIPLPRPHVPIVCNSMWAISDFSEDNGATRLVPRSHEHAAYPQPWGEQPDAVVATMRAGSVLVYNGSLWHGGGANGSDAPRLGVACNYCAGWIRQQENQQLGIPLETARGFSPTLRKLAGFHVYKRLIGHIDKCSPLDLLDQCEPRPIVGVMK